MPDDMYRFRRFRRRLKARTLRRPGPLFVLEARELRSDVESSGL